MCYLDYIIHTDNGGAATGAIIDSIYHVLIYHVLILTPCCNFVNKILFFFLFFENYS